MTLPSSAPSSRRFGRVAVALSGGVDSAVTAALMQEKGCDVVAVTLRLFDDPASSAVDDAARVASFLGLEYHVMDAREAFRCHVRAAFTDSYRKGLTPNPCALCNRHIKFGDLLAYARTALGADGMVTGHYVVWEPGEAGQGALYRGEAAERDQSYFLFGLPRDSLPFIDFPLGQWSKDDVRAKALALGLPVAQKKDSQDICFVPDGDYGREVLAQAPDAARPGFIVDEEGHRLGQHEGLIHFTVGQRRGLALGARVGQNNAPLFVISLDPVKNEVVVGPRAHLAQREVLLRDVNWLLPSDLPTEGMRVEAQLRARHKPMPATLYGLETSGEAKGARLVLETPIYGLAPGQAGVLYDGARLLGGGWIVKE